MLHRNHWLFAVLLLPLLVVFSSSSSSSSSSGAGTASPTQQWFGSNFSAPFVEGHLFDHRRVLKAGAVELVDEEEGPPKHVCQAYTIVSWPHGPRTATEYQITPSCMGGAPVACAARPRAPPARS
jgi:hypothetical protein